jgi:Uma2 family endonuclease
MATSTLVPVSEYLSTDYSPDCDYVDGQLVERNVGEKSHGKLSGALFAYLYARRKQLGIFVIQEQRIQIGPTHFRVPDLCVIAGPEPSEEVFSSPPFLCVEILSPEDRVTRMQRRIQDFLSFGVRYVWMIDPLSRDAWIYTRDGMQEVTGGVLRTTDPDIEVPIAALFED